MKQQSKRVFGILFILTLMLLSGMSVTVYADELIYNVKLGDGQPEAAIAPGDGMAECSFDLPSILDLPEPDTTQEPQMSVDNTIVFSEQSSLDRNGMLTLYICGEGTATVSFSYTSASGEIITGSVPVIVALQGNVLCVNLNQSATTIALDEKITLMATVEPDDATDKRVLWSVSGAAVALYSDEACTKPVGTDATATTTVYAKGMWVGNATVTVSSNADSTRTASFEAEVACNPAQQVNITTQPMDLNLTCGYPGTLTVSVEENDDYDLIYQWFTCEDDSKSMSDAIEGANSSSYTIPMNLDVGVTYYYCQIKAVSKEGYSEIAVSGVATVTVKKADSVVTKQPEAGQLTYTGSAQILVTAGEATGGTLYYALGADDATVPEFDGKSEKPDKKWKTTLPEATDAGT